MPVNEWIRARRAAEAWRATFSLPDTLTASGTDQLLESAFTQVGLKVRPRRPDDPLLSGAHAVLDPELRTVWIRNDASAPDRRMILAHELGHVRLHHAPEECRCEPHDLAETEGLGGYGPRQRRETEANAFARALILPAALAQSLFAAGSSAAALARRTGIPVSAVYRQLATHDPEERHEAPSATSPIVGLDPSQERAARSERGPLLVGAGPGTGKTRTLTARVAHLLESGSVRPENILALTFSRRAAAEMQERIAATSPVAAGRISVTTFHSFGLDLIRRYTALAGLPARPVLLGEAEALALLERRIAALPLRDLKYLHDPTFPIPEMLRAIGRAKEERQSPESLAARAAGNPRWEDTASVYAMYQEALRAHGAVDYADLVAVPLEILEAHPEVLESERRRWKAVLVDEYQDINRGGARLVQLLCGPDGDSLWAVGDLRQAIYAFRGAAPANIDRFESDFPGGARLELAVNYRSRPALVAAFGDAAGESPAAWTACREGDASLTVADAEDEAAQALGISRHLTRCHDDGHAWGDMAVLCRTRSQMRALRERLERLGVPVEAGVEAGSLLRDPVATRLLAALARFAEPTGPASVAGPDTVERVSAPQGVWPDDLLCDLLWGKHRIAAEAGPLSGAALLLEMARAFRERASLLVNDGEEPIAAFLQHIRRLARLGAVPGIEAQTPQDRVRLLTIHASKGLEFDVVVVPNVSEGRFPPRPAPSLLPPLDDDADSTTEEERLFFVALTRARDHLIVCHARRYGFRRAQPSPLLRVLDQHGVRETWSAPEDSAPPPDEAAPEAIERPVVSLRDVELYLGCPARYALERIERVPLGAIGAYGAFQKATVAAAANMESAEDAFDSAWREAGQLDTSPLLPFYRTAALDLLAAAGPIAASDPVEERLLELPSGALRVRADRLASDGSVELRTLRRPPDEETETVPLDLRLAALQEAYAAPVQVRYLQENRVLPVRESSRARKNRMESADRALAGIANQRFPSTPSDPAQCPSCPYFFVCPRDGGPVSTRPRAPLRAASPPSEAGARSTDGE